VVLRDNFTFTFMLINNVFQMQSLYIVWWNEKLIM
jgi:hypothetical protein